MASPPLSGTSLSLSPFLIRNHKSKASKVTKPSRYSLYLLVLFSYFITVPCKASKDGDPNIHTYGTQATLSNDPLSLPAPIFPDPNITKCEPSNLPSYVEPISTCCCPIVSSNIIDFKLPLNPKVKVRPAAHLVDETYIQNYNEAVRRMKALPSDDPRNFYQQARLHCAYCYGAFHQLGFNNLDFEIHISWLFFPWHRWFLYFYERILASLIKDLDPNFTIPFWNWDSPNGMSIPSIYVETNSSLYDSLRDPIHLPPKLVNINFFDVEEETTPEEQVSSNLNILYRQIVSSSKTPTLFFGAAYRAGDESAPGPGPVEIIPHGTVHLWTGKGSQEDMGIFYSAARDPIFYSHHGNLDRIWSIWKTLGGKRKDIRDSDWLESGFLFFDENKNFVRVKVKDCLDTTKLGYVYQDVDIPWLHAKPTPRKSKFPLIKKFGVGADETSEEAKFPLVLDSSVRTVVKRLRKSRSEEEKEQEEEVLVIEGIEFEKDLAVRFDVYINDEDDVPAGPTKTEFAGSFVNLPHKHKQTKMKTSLRLGITELLEDLDVEDDEDVMVTLVPKYGKAHVTIGGIKIEFHK